MDLTAVSEGMQTLVSTITIVGVFVALGMMIQNLRTMGRVLEKLEERVDKHIEDRTVHPDVPALERRLLRHERRDQVPN